MSKLMIQEIEDLIGQKLPYKDGLRRKQDLENRYGVTIRYDTYEAVTNGPEDKIIIFSDYK